VPGWRTKRRIVVFESDDWGSIRMPGVDSFNRLQASGLDLVGGDSLRYNTYDTLAGSDDLIALYDTLNRYSDFQKRAPVFTAISLVANPDFEKIRLAQFREYHYEPFPETLKKYYGNDSSYQLWLEGISNNLFVPQFHGREHLNIAVWLKALQEKDSNTLKAYEEGLWGFNNKHQYGISYQAAFDVNHLADLEIHHEVIASGTALFNELFGYRAEYFVPPNGPINNKLEKVARHVGIKYLSASKIQRESLGQGKTKKVFHYLGQVNQLGQTYITRNAFFEPSQEGKDWVDSCLADIAIAFKWNKPVVISTHRVNYIGQLVERNRRNGLNQLDKLINAITQRWPNVEFMTSVELGDIITSGRRNN